MLTPGYIFLLLVVYQLKHFFADYPMQTPYMLQKFKGGTAWILPLCAHAGVHALLTFIIAVFVGTRLGDTALADVEWSVVFFVSGIDFIVHFTMDRIKASPNMLGRYKALSANEYPSIARGADFQKRAQETSIRAGGGALIMLRQHADDCQEKLRGNKLFWWALGLDQMVHHLTHYLLIYLMLALN